MKFPFKAVRYGFSLARFGYQRAVWTAGRVGRSAVLPTADLVQLQNTGFGNAGGFVFSVFGASRLAPPSRLARVPRARLAQPTAMCSSTFATLEGLTVMRIIIPLSAVVLLSNPATAGFEIVRPPAPPAPIVSTADRPVTSIGRAMPLRLALPQIILDRPTEIDPGVSPNTAITWNGGGRPASVVLNEALAAAGLIAAEIGGKIVVQKPSRPPAAPISAAPISLAAQPPAPSVAVSPTQAVPEVAATPAAAPTTEQSTEQWMIEPGLRLSDQLRRWGDRAGYVVDDSGIASCECMIAYGDVAEGDFIAALKKLMRPFARQSPGVQAFVHPNKVIMLKMTRDDFGG